MGCCVSSHEKRATQSQKQSSEQFPCISKSPPRPEEESVKEVLSETPNPKPQPRPDSDPRPELTTPKNVTPKTEYPEAEVLVEEAPTKPKILLTPKKTRPGIRPGSPDPTPVAPACATPEEISDLSEMCSMSESVSTNTLRDRDEDELHVQQQWSKNNSHRERGGYRSQGQTGPFTHTNRALSAGRSPLKRVEPSPPRRRNPVQFQGSARREQGENSGRRSASPGRRTNVGRSPSARRTVPSPSRVRMVQGPNESESERNVEERERESEWQGPNESLENPLVSLECFIFL